MAKKKRPLKYDFHYYASQTAWAFLDVFLLLLLSFVITFSYFYLHTPNVATLAQQIKSTTTIIHDRTGQHVLYEIHGEVNRKVIPHDQIPDVARIATIAAEDDRFYSHSGVDPFAILRAIKNNFVSGDNQQGASTITQQLARNAFLSREKTFSRKILEAVLAIKIERQYSKDQILDMYFNDIPYGANAYGIETAAETFFGKPAQDLTLDEAALLAALPKATTFYSPYGPHVLELRNRQAAILQRVQDLGFATLDAVAQAEKTNTLAKIIPSQQKIDAPHFVFYVRDELEKKFGPTAVEEGGLQVLTTLDYDKQKLAENIIQAEAATTLKNYGASNAALVSLDATNGQILAMVGSKNYSDPAIDGQVNVATRPRQPGSSFKPFAYATAFEKGYQPETMVLDAQTDFGPDGSGHDYIPRNYDGKFHGLVSMRQALAGSLNIPAVKTLYAAGVADTIDTAHRLGITTLNEPDRYGLSLVLGGGEVKLLDMAAGYSVFANDGIKNSPEALLQVTNTNGKNIFTASTQNESALDPQVARKINSILSDNAARTPIFGPHNKLFIPGKTVAAKTGTTQEWRDAWTIGYTPYLVTGVWAGNNNNAPMRAGADGSYVAAPIWNKFMSAAIASQPDQTFLAYDKSPAVDFQTQVKITYYKKKNGKKISQSTAQKMNPAKVDVKIDTNQAPPLASAFSFLNAPFGAGAQLPFTQFTSNTQTTQQ